jgi:hypothetical protein
LGITVPATYVTGWTERQNSESDTAVRILTATGGVCITLGTSNKPFSDLRKPATISSKALQSVSQSADFVLI